VVQRCSAARGTEAETDPGFQDLAVPRLFYRDGLTRPEVPAEPFTRLRLVQETAGLAQSPSPATSLKIFQLVAGATVDVSGAPPEGLVQVTAAVTTSAGRAFTWSIGTTASPSGAAVFRVPYATGSNGASTALLAVEAGGRAVPLHLADADVLEGRRVSAALRAH
jgi:asparagine N-glycosylation enzyme membrane subunit Stt3